MTKDAEGAFGIDKDRGIHMKFSDMPYSRIDAEEVIGRYQELEREMRDADSGARQWEIHQSYYEVFSDYKSMMTIAEIRHDVDVTDAYYKEEKAYYDEIAPQVETARLSYLKALVASPFREQLQEHIGEVAFKSMEIAFRAMDERVVSLKQEENRLMTEYELLIATAKIDWEGEELNLSLLRPYMTHTDRAVRKRAYEKFSGFFCEVGGQLDDIYDRLVKNRTKQAQQLGANDFRALGYDRMNRHSYGPDEVERFRRQIKEYFVPFAQKVQENRRRRLGIEKLAFYDEGIAFAQGNPRPTGSPREIMEAGQHMYAQLSQETKQFFDFMMENELFDVLGRKTKKAGGYMTEIPKYASPYIFANFNGTSGDVDVITHECGHAFQGYISAQDPVMEHRDITMDTAEIHSMSMEFFTSRWMELFFGEGADEYRKMQLEDAILFIPYGCMVDEFQHTVYEQPDMTAQERHALWRRLEREYKPHLDYEGDPYFEKGGFWQKQTHIYTDPFYYIDYVLAQFCALQYKLWMDEHYEEAWDSYLRLCHISAGRFYEDMLRAVGLSSPFAEGSVQQMTRRLASLVEV